jgi:WhiB family redox-sensing transcriptional regulator
VNAVATLDPFTNALCRGETTSRFFPEDFESPDPGAIALCHRCEAREICLAWALSHDEVGIWGGLTDDQRRAINTQRNRVKCPDCRSYEVAEQGGYEVCLSCGLSWPV